MDVVNECCAGLDIHRDTVVASVITPTGRELRTFGTVTDELLALADWLLGLGVTQVAMESTGIYWKPIYNLLEGTDLGLLVVNARHIKAVPGRKTDVKDAEWIADLLRHGLLRGSYIPDRGQRELRELVRYRRRLIEERSREAERLHKTLEGANVKLGAVASNILGVSGRAMLDALVSGRDDPETLAGLAVGATPRQARPAGGRAQRSRRSAPAPAACHPAPAHRLPRRRGRRAVGRDRGADAPFRPGHRAGRHDPGGRSADG